MYSIKELLLMNEAKLIMMKVNDAIEAGKDKKGNVLQIPIFNSIQIIDGELYGIIDGYMDPPVDLQDDQTIKH